ncbi:MAG: AsmA family protein [Sphingomonadales bacterium]|nr:AsmA family protein [Sphingomonadales bacterium]
MIDRPPPDLSDIWHDGPATPRQAERPAVTSRKPATRRTRPRRRRRWLSVLGYGALAFACLGAAAIAFLLVAAPVDLVRGRVIEQVKTRTGRDLTITGPTTLSFFPRPAVALSDVSLSAPGDMEAPPTLIASMVEAELPWWSLLTAQPAIERITLHRPTIELSVDARGRRSWSSTGLRSRRSPPPAADNAQTPSGEPSPASEPKQVTAAFKAGGGSIRILDGVVRYRDQRSGSRTEIDSLNVTLAADGPDAPLRVDGTVAVRGTQLAIDGTVSPSRSLMADQPAQIALKVSGAPFEGTYQGTFALAAEAGLSLDGALKLRAASARALADWLGRPLAASGEPDAVAFSADLKATPVRVALSNLQSTVGTATIAGSLALDTTQERRLLSGNLEISELDIGRLLVKPDRHHTSTPAPSTAPAAAPAPPASDKRGRQRDWGDDPINLPMLGLLDANLTVSAGSLIYKQAKTGPSRLSVALEKGLGRVTLEDVALYGGRGRGLLTLDGTGDVLVTGANFRFDGVALRPLLTDALDFPWLEGRGTLSFALAGQGFPSVRSSSRSTARWTLPAPMAL